MATLSSAVSSAISKSLLSNLSGAMATKFSLEEAECKTFLQEYLSTQLVKGKGGRAPRLDADGKPVKGAVSGYIVFSTENRADVTAALAKANGGEKPQFSQVGSELGRRWKALEQSAREEYTSKAQKQNADNGSRVANKTPAKTPAATPAAGGRGAKAAAAAPAKAAASAAAKPAARPAAKQAAAKPAAKAAAAPPRKQARPVARKPAAEDSDEE